MKNHIYLGVATLIFAVLLCGAVSASEDVTNPTTVCEQSPVCEQPKPPVCEQPKPPVCEQPKPPVCEQPKPPVCEQPKPPVSAVSVVQAAGEPPVSAQTVPMQETGTPIAPLITAIALLISGLVLPRLQ
jgi:hypothetical protein